MKPEREQHRGGEPDRAAVDRAQPVEDLHAGGDRDEHRRQAERGDRDRPEPGGEHVVRPHAPAEEADRDAGEHHDRVAEQRLAARTRAASRRRCPCPAGSGCTPRDGRTTRTDAGRAADRRPSTPRRTCVSKLRSKNTMISAAVMIGIANTVRNATTSIIQVNTGMRMSVMPGARMLRIGDDEVDRRRRRPDAEQHDARRPRSRARGRAARRRRSVCS